MISERDRDIAERRELGYKLPFLGREFGITKQRASEIVQHVTEHLNFLELELLKARKTGDAFGLVVPHQPKQEDRQAALDYFEWVKSRLIQRGVELEVEHRPTSNGSVFFIKDVTDYEGRNNA